MGKRDYNTYVTHANVEWNTEWCGALSDNQLAHVNPMLMTFARSAHTRQHFGHARLLASFAFAVAITACSADDTVKPCTVTAVAVTSTAASIVVGQTTQATANVTSQNCATPAAVVWTSENDAVASVSSTGVVTGVTAGGPVSIRAAAGGITGTLAVTVTLVPVASVTMAPTTATLVPQQGTDLVATARDAANNVLTGRTVTWTTSNAAIATVVNGRVTAVSAGGPVTITATIGGVAATAAITVVAPTLLAYGVASTPAATASYNATEAFSGAGDVPTVSRTSTGIYEVIVPGMAAGNTTQRSVYVTSRAAAAQCHPNGTPGNGANGQLLLHVVCASVTTGLVTDASFSFVAFGRDVFAGRLGFMATPTAAIPTVVVPTSPFTFTSRGLDATVTALGTSAGVYTTSFTALARVGADKPENIFQQSWDVAPGSWCASGGWSLSVFSATVYCYDAAGVATNARFGAFVFDGGRTAKRFALAWVSDPATPTAPILQYSQSTGGAVTIAKVSVGVHDVTFPGLAGSATVPVAVFASSYASGLVNSHCSVTTISRTGADLVARVQCVAPATGAPRDQPFTIAVVE